MFKFPDLLFASKTNHSSVQCISTIKDIIDSYNLNSSPEYVYQPSLQKCPYVERNESGIIPDLSKKYCFNLNVSIFCLLIIMQKNIVFCVSTVILYK